VRIPRATYRVQLNSYFGFQNLKAILPYLNELGISHIYASPIFSAKKGSTHGYDITDPNTINPELGGQVAFEDLMHEVTFYGLGWIQDIVPNHASYSFENNRVEDLLVKGVGSRYAKFFDVNWSHPSPKLRGKILLPILFEPYRQSLKEGKIALIYQDGFKIQYNNLTMPLDPETLKKLNSENINQTIELHNSKPEFLDKLLSEQHYTVAYWKTALKHINYRRFFDIAELIGLCQENPEVFEETHQLILEQAEINYFDGLRVDHVDGLYDPEAYLLGLRQRLPDIFLLVEKILTGSEQLPCMWPVEGTTGYDFCTYVNKLFVQADDESKLTECYEQFTGIRQAFKEQLYECKKAVIETSFLGDTCNLRRLFNKSLASINYNKPYKRSNLLSAIIELLACFPVYRCYLSPNNADAESLQIALKDAKQRNPTLTEEFSAITHLLSEIRTSSAALHAFMRLQQLSGAIMAKGFEDTALYRYNRLLSLNEVGSNPEYFGISLAQFHDFNSLKQTKCRFSLNASSTHDSKRGEDVRARINVLSEIPREFRVNIKAWSKLNASRKHEVNGELAPSKNEEYYLYQTLLGAFPWTLRERPEFIERIKLHMVKALREAKINSNWLSPDLSYEKAVSAFTTEILSSNCFLEAFLPFQLKVAFHGFYNTLAQTLLKITCPGIPDFYQGSELWDLNLVDPDNRRPVNYPVRQKLLAEIALLDAASAPKLLEHVGDVKAKLYVIYRALQVRREMAELLEQGDYLPLAVKGVYAKNVLAFCRRKGDGYAVVCVPLFSSNLLRAGDPWSSIDWGATYLALPKDTPQSLTDAFTSNTLTSKSGTLQLRDVLGSFPVALLFSGESDG
jgi:(1->4)-alpha-D-glucan 1-alpha-D-glucosylmutase